MIRPAIRETTSVLKWHPSPKATSATPKVISRVGTFESSNEITPLLPRPSARPMVHHYAKGHAWEATRAPSQWPGPIEGMLRHPFLSLG